MAKKKRADFGLTPAIIIQQMAKAAHGKKVREVRSAPAEPERSVLPEGRPGGVEEAGGRGIFAAPSRDDPERAGGSQSPEVPDAEGSGNGEQFRTQLSRVLKRMLGETPPAELVAVEELGRVGTNAEALAAVIQREAFAGKQWACEFWRDMAEGKPVRAAQINNSENEVEAALDRVSLAALNRLAEKG